MNPIMHTYASLPLAFTHGKGAWLFDADGKQYLDALSGIAVCGLGHAHPAVTQAIIDQAGSLLHTSNLFTIEAQGKLAAKLTDLSGMDNVFFCNSGAEANETAIKLARYYGNRIKEVKQPSIIVTEGSFHGRTMATLSATGNRKIQAGFEPLVGGFVRAPYNDLEAIRCIAKNNTSIVAILVEPIQGEGGICIPDAGYLRELRNICDENEWLLMLDEVQTGNGRTGKLFAYQHEGILPDVVTTAKGLGNGVPIGCCLAANKAKDVLQPGSHASTFGGNPLASAAALAVLETIENEKLADRAAVLSKRIKAGLQPLLDQEKIKELRVAGLMFGLDLGRPCAELVTMGLDQGIVVNVTADSVLRLLPPLILTDDEADQLVEKTLTLVDSFLS